MTKIDTKVKENNKTAKIKDLLSKNFESKANDEAIKRLTLK